MTGVGLHTGARTTVRLNPAPVGYGVAFLRADLPGRPAIEATVDRVSATDRRTVLGEGDGAIQTVEHLLAAVAAHRIDDLVVELDGPEPPIGDGSAAPYFQAIARAGLDSVGGSPQVYRVTAPFALREGEASYLVSPARHLRLTVTIEWDHPAIGRQSGCFDITPERFANELSAARTFGFEHELEKLRASGLIRGAAAGCAVLLSETGVKGSLLWPDEFVRHKATDLLGDLALLGGRLEAEVVAFRPSHKGNVALVRALRRITSGPGPTTMGIGEILGAMPHRYPMLLVDRILEIQERERIVGIKNVTINEPFFQGHFPGHPIMPGVLIIEAMGQVGGMLLMGMVDDPATKVVYFMSIDNVKFRRPVVPGDQIRFELDLVQFRGKTCRMRGLGLVDGQVVAEADMMARIVDR